MIDGIFLGCLAAAKSLGLNAWDCEMMDIAREIIEKHQRNIMIEGNKAT